MAGFRVDIIPVAPAADLGGAVVHVGINVTAEKPEGHIDTLDFIDMVLVLKDFQQESLTL